VNGKRIRGIATQWIGDKDAYERFREYEAKQRCSTESGRAINAALFADELARFVFFDAACCRPPKQEPAAASLAS
jgi:hypothetical protein